MIIGLDLGAHFGIAVGDGGNPQCDCLDLPKDPGAAALRVEGRLRMYIRENTVTGIAFEDPFPTLGKKWQQSGQAEIKTHLTTQFGQKYLILKVAHEENIPTMPIHVSNARKLIVGKGFPSEDEIMAAAFAAGARPANHHEADGSIIYFAAVMKGFR